MPRKKSVFYTSLTIMIIFLLVGYTLIALLFGRLLSNTIYAEVHYKFVFEFLNAVKVYFLYLHVNSYNGWNQLVNDSILVNLHISDDHGNIINETKLDLLSLFVDGEIFTFDTFSHSEVFSIFINVTLMPLPPTRFMPTSNSSFMLLTNDAVLEVES